MAKVNIDLEKLLCALMKRYYLIHNIDRSQVKCWLDDVLEDCGIEYKDGSLHYIGEEEVKWYKCIKEYDGFFTGKIYKINENGYLPSDPKSGCPIVLDIRNPYFKTWFTPADEEEVKEIEKKPDTIKFEEEPKKKVKLADLDDMEELRTTIKESIRRQKYIDQFEKTNEATEAQHVIGSGEKMPDIDVMVEEFRSTINLCDNNPYEHCLKEAECASYRQGLEDMWKHLKGE